MGTQIDLLTMLEGLEEDDRREALPFIDEFRPDYCIQCEVEPASAAAFLRDHYRDTWGTCRTYLSRANVAVGRAPFASRFTPEALAHQPMGRVPHHGHQPVFLHYCICGHYYPTFEGLTNHIIKEGENVDCVDST